MIAIVEATAAKVQKHGDADQIKQVMDIKDTLLNKKANVQRKKQMISGYIDKLDDMANNPISNDELFDVI